MKIIFLLIFFLTNSAFTQDGRFERVDYSVVFLDAKIGYVRDDILDEETNEIILGSKNIYLWYLGIYNLRNGFHIFLLISYLIVPLLFTGIYLKNRNEQRKEAE